MRPPGEFLIALLMVLGAVALTVASSVVEMIAWAP